MAGEEEDKENTPVHGRGKKGAGAMEGAGSTGRRLSSGGSKSRPRYLQGIASRFQRKGGLGRGCLTKHQPLQVDVSPYDFIPSPCKEAGRGKRAQLCHRTVESQASHWNPQSDSSETMVYRSENKGQKRKSFVVFEEDVRSGPSHPHYSVVLGTTDKSSTELRAKKATLVNCTTPTRQVQGKQNAGDVSYQPQNLVLENMVTTEKISTQISAKKSTLEDCIMLKRQFKGEQNAGEATQRIPENGALEDFQTFCARRTNSVAVKQRCRLSNLRSELSNCQDSGSSNHFKRLAARWQLGRCGKLHIQPTPLNMSELKEKFRKMDEEESPVMQIQENGIQEKDFQEDQEVVLQKARDVDNRAHLIVEEQAHLGTLEVESLNLQDWELLSPTAGGLERGREIEHKYLTTPELSNPKEKLRMDQEITLAESSPVILELGNTPEAFDAERALIAVKQQTPLKSPTSEACTNQDLDNVQGLPEEVEWTLAQTVEAVQVWSVELDPSRRRRESLQYYSSRPSPWLKRLALSPLRSPNQLSGADEADQLQRSYMPADKAQLSFADRPSSSPRHSTPPHLPANDLVEFSEERFIESMALPSHPEQNAAEIFDRSPSSSSISGSADRLVALDSRTEEIPTRRDSTGNLSNSHLSCPDQNQVSLQHLPELMVETWNAKASECFLGSPHPDSATPFREADCEAVTPPLDQATPNTVGASPTPPTNPLSVFGYPYRRIDREELGQRWLWFCSPPHSISGPSVGVKKTWTVESALVLPTSQQPTSLEPEESVLSQQDMPVITQENVLPVGKAEAGSGLLDDMPGITTNHPPSISEEGAASDLQDMPSIVHEAAHEVGEEEATSSLPDMPSITQEEPCPNSKERAASGLQDMPVIAHEDVQPVGEEDIASSEDDDGGMDYADDVHDISDDSTCIVQTGASSSYNDQEGTSALKQGSEDHGSLVDEVYIEATPVKDFNALNSVIDLAEYPSAHQEEEHIDEFVNALQVTPSVLDTHLGGSSAEGDGETKEVVSDHCPDGEAEQANQAKQPTTPKEDKGKQSADVDVKGTPVQQKTKTKRPRKRTKSLKVDSPLDAGSKWSNGQRKSTRIKSKPLEWWRGEKLLYGRVHSTLNTLIGIKHLSPDPVWPRPQDKKNKAPRQYKVDSFVPAKYNDLIRLAAQ